MPFNESWGVPDLAATAAHRHFVQGLYHLTKSLDPTRPVIGNDGWESTATDIVGIHDYESRPEKLAKRYGPETQLSELFGRTLPAGRLLALTEYSHKGQPIMLTEFGGIAYAKRDNTEEDKTWGYVKSNTLNDLQLRYKALLEVVNRVELLSGFCYTQFSDTFQEANGLLYADRTPKFPLAEIATATLGQDEIDDRVLLAGTGQQAQWSSNELLKPANSWGGHHNAENHQ